MKLYKKIIIICLILLFIIIVYIIISGNVESENRKDNENNEKILPEFPQNMSYSDKITYIMQDKTYQNGNMEYKIELMCKLLDEFISQEIIEEYNVNASDERTYIICKLSNGNTFDIVLNEFKKNENK